MPCGRKRFRRIRAVDVGRPGHHYIKIGIITKTGKRGGVSVRLGGLKLYKKRRR